MPRAKNVVVLTQMSEEHEGNNTQQQCYSSLKKACEVHGWSYHTIVKKKLPIIKDGWLINRLNLK